jgi:hypothetical protein
MEKTNPERYDLDFLAKAAKASLRYYYANKSQQQARNKVWRSKNKATIKEKQRQTKRIRKQKAIEYMGGFCHHCNKKFHNSIYEFHHKDPINKDKDLSKMMLLSWQKLCLELDKCLLLCANCHRFEHHGKNY